MTHPHRRRWVKLWTQEALFGTTRSELNPEERSIWWDFLALAGDSTTPGIIQIAPGIPYDDRQLSGLLNVPRSLLRRARDKMVEHGKVRIEGGSIRICNWEHYQADYVRVQRHRERVTSETPMFPVTPETPSPEEEGRGGKGGVVKHTPVSNTDNNSTQRHARAGNFPRACELYDQTFGKVTQKARRRLYQMCLDYEIAWIEEAFKETQKARATRLNYIEAILERWGRDGYKAPRPRDARYPPTAAQRRDLPTEEQLQREWATSETSQ